MLQEVLSVCGNLGRQAMLGALFCSQDFVVLLWVQRFHRFVFARRSPITHPLHFQSGQNDHDGDDDADDPDDHHYASPASPAVAVMTS